MYLIVFIISVLLPYSKCYQHFSNQCQLRYTVNCEDESFTNGSHGNLTQLQDRGNTVDFERNGLQGLVLIIS